MTFRVRLGLVLVRLGLVLVRLGLVLVRIGLVLLGGLPQSYVDLV